VQVPGYAAVASPVRLQALPCSEGHIAGSFPAPTPGLNRIQGELPGQSETASRGTAVACTHVHRGSDCDVCAGTDAPFGYLVVSQSEWKGHPTLRHLQMASDMDSDSAFMLWDMQSSDANDFEPLVLQFRSDEGPWVCAAFGTMAFPSRGWAWSAAWYGPFDRHWFDYGNLTWRALLPDDWEPPSKPEASE